MRIAIVSVPARVATNRAPYRHMHQLGISVLQIYPISKQERLAYHPDAVTSCDGAVVEIECPNLPNRLKWIPGLTQEINRFQATHIHFDGEPDSLPSIVLARYAKRNGLVYTCQTYENIANVYGGVTAGQPRYRIKKAISQLFGKCVNHGLKHVFACSRNSVVVMNQRGYGGKVSKIPLGYDPNIFYPDRTRNQALRDQKGISGVVVAYFGRLNPSKGIEDLIDALALLQHLPFTFIVDDFLHASGEYGKILKAKIESSPLVKRTVYITAKHGEIAEWMRVADLTVVPSYHTATHQEQYGRVVAEAMACGSAILVSRSGALPELVEDDRQIFDFAAGHDQLYSKLSELIHSPHLLAELGERNARQAEAHLSAAKQVEQMLQVYSNL